MRQIGVFLLLLAPALAQEEGATPVLPCPVVDGGIRLDGRLSEEAWGEHPGLPLARREQVHPGFQAGWSGPQDLSGRVRALRSGPDLILGFEITDDVILHESGRSWWCGDSIEVFLDTDRCSDEDDRVYSSDDFQIFLMPFHEGLRWGVVSRGPGVPYPDGGLHGIEVAVSRGRGGYSLEARIPLAQFDTLRPAADGHIGFDVALNDVDSPGSTMTETYMTLSGRFDLHARPENFAALALGRAPPVSTGGAGRLPPGLPWGSLVLGILGVVAVALLGRVAVRRLTRGTRMRLVTLCGLSVAGAAVLTFAPSLASLLDEGTVRRRYAEAVSTAAAAARGHLLLDARPPEERAERLLALFRDGQVRIRPRYRYHLLPLTPPERRLPGAIDYRIRLAPGEARSFPLDGVRTPRAMRLDVALPEPGERQSAGLPALQVRLDFAEGSAVVHSAGRGEASRVLIDTSEREGVPLRAIEVRNLLSFQPIVVNALHAGPSWTPLPLAARTPSGVPIDVWHGTPATHILEVRGGSAVVSGNDLAGQRLWIAVDADGAYPKSAYGVDAARIRVVYRPDQPGPELTLRNGIDLQDHLLAYAHAAGGPSTVALAWEDDARLPAHYTLHAIDLDPNRAVDRIEFLDLSVLSSFRVAAATLGVLDTEPPPAGSGLAVQRDRLSLDTSVRELWSGFGFRVHAPGGAIHAFGPDSGVRAEVDLPFGDGARGRLELVLPSDAWALAVLRARSVFYGAAALLLAFAALLLGSALLQRAHHLRVKMLVALGAATVAPLLFLGIGLTTQLGERAEETLRQATLSDLGGLRARIGNARAEANGLAARVRDTLELVRPRGAGALSHQVRRAREEVAAEGAFLRLPELAGSEPSPLGNTRFVDTVTRPGLYYSPWDGLMAIGVAGTADRHRCLVGIRNEALLGPAAPGVEAVLFGPAGDPLAGTRGVPPDLRAAERRPGGADPAPSYDAFATLRGERVAVARQRLRDRGQTLGEFAVYRSRRATDEAKAAIFRTILISGLAALALVVLAGGTLVDRVTARLQRVTRAARALAHGDLSSRVPLESEDEVGRLADSFNRMADALDERVRQLTDLHGGLQELTAALAPDEVAGAAARLLVRATGARHVLVASFERATERLEPLHREGDGAPLGTRLPESGPARDAVALGAPVLREGALFLPLLSAGRAVGIAVCSPVADAPDDRFLDATARQIGIALENARLYRAAVTDELTGLYTHPFLVRRLREEVDRASATGRSLSLLRVVIEDFPGVSLRQGVAIAAKLVAETAAVLQRTLPRRDMVCRREGGELMALLVESGAEDARRRTERVAEALRRHEFRALRGEPRPEFRFRSVTYPRDGAAADILLDTLFEATESWQDALGPEPSSPLKVPLRLGVLLGKSPTMRAALEIVARVAPTNATVLLSGETGAGKEVLADLIQHNGDRREGPYMKVNCAAIPENLLEAELFGHERGAFTGAERRRIGRFEEAHRGTLFLDEIGDLPLGMQVKLLRFLQERRITRVGGSAPLDVDVRILAASNRDLAEAVRRGEFREDLYHRLHVIELRVPPLRERREDIPGLIEHFRRLFNQRHGLAVAAFSPDALDRLYRHPWPGNVRELKNVMERSMLLADGPMVDGARLALPEPAPGKARPAVAVDGLTPRQERILTHARKAGGVTNSDIAQGEDVSSRTALRELQRLVDRGLLLRVGRRRGAVYRPT